jgi:hypothetical protein
MTRRMICMLPLLLSACQSAEAQTSQQSSTGTPFADIDRLVAIEDIKQLKARYLRTLDSKKWNEFEAVFAPDVVFDLREGLFARDQITGEITKSGDILIGEDQIVASEWMVTGASAVRQWVEGILSPVVTVHHVHSPEITLTSATTAHAYWPMEHILRFPRINPYSFLWFIPDNLPHHQLQGWGTYEETYERRPEGWRIKTLKLTHYRVDIK